MNDDLIGRLANAFAARGKHLYLVGGSVRDALLGLAPKDLDFATDADPAEVRAIVASVRADGLAALGEKFGTLHLVYGADEVEITPLRPREDPKAGAAPAMRVGTSIEDDLSRRDFTINAIARDTRTGALIDPFGGQRDLQAGVIRAVGSPAARFAEDPLRLLRAVRFAAQFDFSIADETLDEMRERASTLASVTSDRIRDEFARILTGPDATRGMELLFAAGLLAVFLPEVVALAGVDQPPWHRLDVYQHTLAVMRLTEPRLVLRLAALLHDIAKPQTKTMDGAVSHFYRHEEVGAAMARRILRRLRFGGTLVTRVEAMVALHMRVGSYTRRWSDASVRRLFVAAGDLLDDLIALEIADSISDRDEPAEEARARFASLRERLERLRTRAAEHPLASPLSGDELMAHLGRPPGPWIGHVKAYLTDLVIDGRLDAIDKEGARHAAEMFLATNEQPQDGALPE